MHSTLETTTNCMPYKEMPVYVSLPDKLLGSL